MTSDSTVVIADDSLVIRAVVRAGLEVADYNVIEAEDGIVAIEQCRQWSPDVILLDIEMPGLNGYQVLAELKQDKDLARIPVVFLTVRASMDDVLATLSGGAHDYLKKPFEPAELVARVAAAVRVKKLQDQLHEHNAELDRISRIDMLTGIYNRRHLEETLQHQHNDARRRGDTLACVLLDIDRFKQVNDTYGHAAGDTVLCEFGRRLLGELRSGDIAGRWGGEEFLVILPRTDIGGAIQLAERIRTAVAASPIWAATGAIAVTVSGGCAVGPLNTADEIVHEADKRLYQAKVSGRDRIIASSI